MDRSPRLLIPLDDKRSIEYVLEDGVIELTMGLPKQPDYSVSWGRSLAEPVKTLTVTAKKFTVRYPSFTVQEVAQAFGVTESEVRDMLARHTAAEGSESAHSS
jgi:hypothetical protein